MYILNELNFKVEHLEAQIYYIEYQIISFSQLFQHFSFEILLSFISRIKRNYLQIKLENGTYIN